MELLNVRGVGYRLATKNKATSQRLVALFCGKTGIRTLGTRKGTTVFETVPIDHSGIFPSAVLRCKVMSFF